MENNTLVLDTMAKNQICQLIEGTGLDVSTLIKQIIKENETYRNRIEDMSKDLKSYKERELEALLIGDALYDGIYVIDKTGIITAVNKAFIEMTGIVESEILGQGLEWLIERKLVTESGLLVLKEKEKASSVTVINNQKIVITASPIFNELGELTQVLTIMRDVTGLRKLQDKLENSEKLTKKYVDELKYLRKRESAQSGLIGRSLSMSQVRQLIYQVAQVEVTVLITGETGVGKEVVANDIYKNSLRKDSPYIKVNCAAIPENLLESELFGYEKGAFTGAQNKDKLGLFEIANSGTILLDEIGEMPFNLQSKILRVLQEKEITRIGGFKPIKIDVRVIAATNQNLEEQVSKGMFRQDLYYRLNVVPIQIPPLRSRLEDIPLLVNHFLHKYNEKYKVNKYINNSAMEVLQQYDWPGNVRELGNIIERLIIVINEPVIDSDHIVKIVDNEKLAAVCFDKNNLTLKEAVSILERQMIMNALQTYGSTHKAAPSLGVSQPTVLRKAKELGIMAK
ncbi:PAS domain-containing protein [Desulfosporosinus fructosivorans]|uniref:HTH-type transcriptional regulatory protein TyrR n=1 Tax=Desulfosporosinus fructosivorans TaxID=2018669 RepID=A0A4Z0R5I8_9FIRM|nr:sigma 54-interacting transcriptional regulator [Desulfosporosinus fructosivorans]TGE38371.1 PAS domain-containing protein [Desulfosporosinus fructosivorans]